MPVVGDEVREALLDIAALGVREGERPDHAGIGRDRDGDRHAVDVEDRERGAEEPRQADGVVQRVARPFGEINCAQDSGDRRQHAALSNNEAMDSWRRGPNCRRTSGRGPALSA
jgi:hypothetical protein